VEQAVVEGQVEGAQDFQARDGAEGGVAGQVVDLPGGAREEVVEAVEGIVKGRQSLRS